MLPAGLRRVFTAAATICLTIAWFAIFHDGARSAGNNDCILDNCADKKPPASPAPQPDASPKPDPAAEAPAPQNNYYRPRPSGASQPGDFDFYVFSLSWSPGFCATEDRQRSQCATGSHMGFVVHGLWPQYEHGFPSDCAAGRYPSRIALQSAEGLFPDEGLARYEWRKHGTCSGKSPTDYFADVRTARETIKIPQPFVEPNQQQTWAPVDIERAFIAANPRLRPGMLAVACRQGTFQEVRICFSKDVRDFKACPEVVRSDCRTRDLSVPPLR